MSEVSTNPFVEAVQCGLSPIPIDTSTKRPLVAWKQFQEAPAELLVLQGWAGRNIGIVCGTVSGRLVCIDIEAAFLEGHGLPELAKRLKIGEVYNLWWSWMEGYCESTARGGLHILIRLEGSGPMEGNRKLAMASATEVLIETRGEGGYVITAPSRNGARGWELMRGGFDSIAYATLDEWSAVAAVLASFDDSPPTPPPLLPVKEAPSLFVGESWVEAELSRLPQIRTVLSSHGWSPTNRHDEYGEHWTRPDKDPRQGCSGSISEAERLYVHSTNAGLPVGNPTLDTLDVILFYQLGRRPSPSERVEFLRAQRPDLTSTAGADPGGGAADLNLPDDFWQARPYLAHIRQAALARRLSPDAVWEAVKCFYAASIPWNHRLPGDGTMDYISIVVGPSGAGKSRAKTEAYNLLEELHSLDGVRFPAPVGSGEGMTAAYLHKDPDGPKYINRGIGWYADEAKFVLDIASRPGNTTMQAFKQGWSGELTGSVAATAERHRWLDPRDVRFTLLMSVTPGIGARFLSSDLTDEGLPQRVSWGWAIFDHEDARPEHPGPLHVPVFDHNRTKVVYTLELEPELEALVDAHQLALARGEGEGLEGHATYATLKGAAILAHLDGRMAVTMQDWRLSEIDWAKTCSIRRHLLTGAKDATTERNTQAGIARAHSRIAENDIYIERAVHSLVSKLRSVKEPLSMRQIKDHLRAFSKRHGIHHREVLDLAIGRGLASERGGSFFAP